MIINVPNLVASQALDFCANLNEIKLEEGESCFFDFSHVHTCDPFPMLIVSNEIRKKRQEWKMFECYARCCNNQYARHMKFYRACGIGLGNEVTVSKENSNYSCITKMSVEDLRKEGMVTLDVIQEVIDKRSKVMAHILAQGNTEFENWLAFVIREIVRNIPEHSKSDTIWYCAQCWPSYDLVELAIMDEGIGIRESLRDNLSVCHQIKSDMDAIMLSLQPGVSRAFAGNANPNIKSEWDNSGYGLYMVSQMCAELNADFIIASGDTAIRITKRNWEIIKEQKRTNLHGTAIQIRVRPSQTVDYDKIRKEILYRGELQAREKQGTIHVASKSSRGVH